MVCKNSEFVTTYIDTEILYRPFYCQQFFSIVEYLISVEDEVLETLATGLSFFSNTAPIVY